MSMIILHHEDEREVKRLDNIIDRLLTIYEHLSFGRIKKIDSIFMPSELVDDTAVERNCRISSWNSTVSRYLRSGIG